jgi:SAM-dependent methyltransferase
MTTHLIYDLNKKYYDSPGVPDSYARRRFLFESERTILDRLSGVLRDKVILDMGIGPGRTIPYISALTRDYVGFDYSLNMMKIARDEFPGLALLLGDARKLCFASETFDAVFFSWNALDDVGHRDRLGILGEVRRVLKAGGYFVFSSHNLSAPRKSAYTFGGFATSTGPVDFVRKNIPRLGHYARGILNHRRNRAYEVHEDRYSIINDQAHGYSLLTYYISRENQVKQLAEEGFERVEAVNGEGVYVAAGERCDDGCLYYVARKA